MDNNALMTGHNQADKPQRGAAISDKPSFKRDQKPLQLLLISSFGVEFTLSTSFQTDRASSVYIALFGSKTPLLEIFCLRNIARSPFRIEFEYHSLKLLVI